MAVPANERPIRLVVRDDLRRNRLTVFLRFFLAIPHLIWLTLWGIAASVVAFILWIGILIQGEAPGILHDFVAGYIRYATHVGAYLFLAANPFPGFRGTPGYPIDVEIDPPRRQNRWTVGFRYVLALPAITLAAALGSGFAWGSLGGLYVILVAVLASAGVGAMAAFLVWFSALVRGRAPQGLRDVTAYALGYGAQAGGYALLLTDRYPSSDPALVEPAPELPEHPVRIVVTDELVRSRLTVLFRLLLAIPHFVWLMLWFVAVFFALIGAWFAALVMGRVPSALHRFLAAYVRYSMHVFAYVTIVGRKFPGFVGRRDSYGIDLQIDPPARQSRWKILFRFFLYVPAALVAGAFGGALWIVAFLGWWSSLIRGRVPEGLRNLGVACLRYQGQAYAYLFLLTDRYPFATPVLEGRPPAAEEPAAVALGEPF